MPEISRQEVEKTLKGMKKTTDMIMVGEDIPNKWNESKFLTKIITNHLTKTELREYRK